MYFLVSHDYPTIQLALVVERSLIFAVIKFNLATRFESVVKPCNIEHAMNFSAENSQ